MVYAHPGLFPAQLCCCSSREQWLQQTSPGTSVLAKATVLTVFLCMTASKTSSSPQFGLDQGRHLNTLSAIQLHWSGAGSIHRSSLTGWSFLKWLLPSDMAISFWWICPPFSRDLWKTISHVNDKSVRSVHSNFQAHKLADVKTWLAHAKNFIWSIDSEGFTIKWFISADCPYSK